jgi:hypothetical protein
MGNNFPMDNPYEFQPPVAPHGQNGFNQGFAVPMQRGMTPPVQNNPRMGQYNAYSNMPDPNGPLPSHTNVNQSMEAEGRGERVLASNAQRIMTPSGPGMRVGGNESVLEGRKKQMKNQWQQELLEQMEEKKRAKDEEKRRRDMEEMEEEKKIERERQEIDRKYQEEQDKKKQEIAKMQQDNVDLMEAHKRKTEAKVAPGRFNKF